MHNDVPQIHINSWENPLRQWLEWASVSCTVCSSLDFRCLLSKQHLNEGGIDVLSLNLPFSLHCVCVSGTVEQSQSQANPNLRLVKISHSFFPFRSPSKPCSAEQSALLDQICCRLSYNIPCLQRLDYTIKLYRFAFQSLSFPSKPEQQEKPQT